MAEASRKKGSQQTAKISLNSNGNQETADDDDDDDDDSGKKFSAGQSQLNFHHHQLLTICQFGNRVYGDWGGLRVFFLYAKQDGLLSGD